MSIRKLILVVGTVAAVTAAATGCSSSSSGGSNPSTITIWSSMDQPVIDGLSAKLNPLAKAKGITVKWLKIDNINQLIVSKVQANDPPDIALLPQPGVIKDQIGRAHV